MLGAVGADQPLLTVPIRRTSGPEVGIEFVVDTGFVGYLTLPCEAVTALDLPFVRVITANLADDSKIDVGLYAATILWCGNDLEVPVLPMGARPLLGTLLLAG
jgi:clan AA aspartic protease